MRRGRAEGRDLLYIPVTEIDEEARRDVRYRVGRLLDRQGRAGVVVALFGVVGAVAMTWGWVDGSDNLNAGGKVVFVAWGISGVLGLYCWWFFERQEWSELRRAYRFRTVEPEDDEEVAAAKRLLLSNESTLAEREQAVHFLLSRGACSPNKVSVVRELVGYVVAFAVVGLFFVAVAWLT